MLNGKLKLKAEKKQLIHVKGISEINDVPINKNNDVTRIMDKVTMVRPLLCILMNKNSKQ